MTTTTNMSWRVAIADTVGFALEMFPGAGGGMGLDALLSDFDGDPFEPETTNTPGTYILCAAGRTFADLQAQYNPEKYGCPVCFPSLRLCQFVCRAWDKESRSATEFPTMRGEVFKTYWA